MKSNIIYIAILLSLHSNFNISAAPVKVMGNAPTYAGDKIRFYVFTDYFAFTEKVLCNAEVDSAGNFECSFKTDAILKVYADLGIFNVHFYAEPVTEYELALPEKVEKEMKDLLNPYFQPIEIQLGIKGAKDNNLNVMIRMFNDSYVPYFNKHVVNVATNQDFTKLDDEIKKFSEPFLRFEHPYFHEYITYRTGLLRFLAYQNKSKKVSNEYFIAEKIAYDNPAYMELFNQVYDSYFMHLSRTDNGKRIMADINGAQDLEKLKSTLEKDEALSDDQVLELVILKNIYDEFYSDRFSRNALLKILEDLITSTKNEKHKAIGNNIKNKVTKLLSGYNPPDFELYDQDSNLVILSEQKDRYVYLNFCAGHSYSCIQEYEALKYLYDKHRERIDIITVSTDASFEAMVKSRKKMKCPWTFVYYGDQPEILENYDIRAFPTYFLINKEGNLERSPAPSPGENFERTLFEIMRSKGEI